MTSQRRTGLQKAGGALSALSLANLAMQTLLAGAAAAAPSPAARGSSHDLMTASLAALSAPAPEAAQASDDARLASTRAMGEESGGSWPPTANSMATTLALGEEAGSRPPVVNPTTYALGDEHSGPRPSYPTTHAIGEENVGAPPPVRDGGGWATTLAVGEEGYAPGPSLPHKNPYTRAIGEW